MKKYCYGCGKEYKGNQCPSCFNTNYTEKPNSQTLKRKDSKINLKENKIGAEV